MSLLSLIALLVITGAAYWAFLALLRRRKRRYAAAFPGCEVAFGASALVWWLPLVAFFLMPVLNWATVSEPFRGSEPLTILLFTGLLFFLLNLVWGTLHVWRWSADQIVVRQAFGRTADYQWADIRQAGISEVFRRVWIMDQDGVVTTLGHLPQVSDLEQAFARNLGERFIGMRKPQKGAV
jgi:hypothetical protein